MEDCCSDCGFDARSATIGELGPRLLDCRREVAAAFGRVHPNDIRRRDQAGTWAAVEYLGHLRDLMAYHRHLIELALADQDPAIDSADPDQAVADASYIDADPFDLLAQFDRRVQRLAALVQSLDDEAAAHPITIGGRALDVRYVACSALHEAHHHCQDLIGLSRR